ncbi:hypothetical protein LTR02_004593 [Friedmanniomyces endolithicus]|uniref:Glycolipid transfer protein domain-containing protein n=1 Tax=Friedmanniomyces endolithicus TaxID=329885 RepID=A0AAN6J2S7_9PEZI|nr:hypothetical protein LTR35_010259 [Friedmanniomyces endolithicus]KAK0282744.1 hypothetical protein LTS00_012046 [Friedmanniomyces endolithicus]KAK0311633.1 hypothetical protein LTR82_014335 [Friedmanniomyces endolithicus]KAK0348017.1 hypothetical protein LTR94_000789 [Friedmanniomyces endolithicus]KAK0815427.1 hypothetical protein LTR59_000500 [Friedmanniomyces endolithicus]
MAAYPPGGTYFDNGKRSFTQVPMNTSKENAISTSEYLEASEALTGLFDVLGQTAFSPIKKDMIQNIKPASFQHPNIKCSNSRGHDFTARALRRNLTQPNEELSVSFRDAYGLTLKQYHSFIIKPIFSAAMSACPYRKDFYGKLGDDEGRVKKDLDEWLRALEDRVKVLNEFLAKPEAKW